MGLVTLSSILDAIIAVLLVVLLVLILRRLVEDRSTKQGEPAKGGAGSRGSNPEYGEAYASHMEEHFVTLLDERHRLREEEAVVRAAHAQKALTTREANSHLKPLLSRITQIDSELKAAGIL